jgi:hypothetical protein
LETDTNMDLDDLQEQIKFPGLLQNEKNIDNNTKQTNQKECIEQQTFLKSGTLKEIALVKAK